MAVGRFRRGQLDALAVAGLGEAWLLVTACGVAGRRSWQFAGHAAATASPPWRAAATASPPRRRRQTRDRRQPRNDNEKMRGKAYSLPAWISVNGPTSF